MEYDIANLAVYRQLLQTIFFFHFSFSLLSPLPTHTPLPSLILKLEEVKSFHT